MSATENHRPSILDEILDGGHKVIDASAGTGKTYTIEQIVIDLLRTGAAQLDQILIVTFTEKATGELRSRIRATIEGVLSGQNSADVERRLNDALAAPMSDVFDPNVTTWSYKAIVPDVLRSTKLPLPPAETARVAIPRHSSAYWAAAMAGQDFSEPDRIDPTTYVRALWRGLKGDEPFPAIIETGADLRTNRAQFLAKTRSANSR